MERRPHRWKPNASDRALRKRRNRPSRAGPYPQWERIEHLATCLLSLLEKFVHDPYRPPLKDILADSDLSTGYQTIPRTPVFKACRDLWATRCSLARPRQTYKRTRKKRIAALNRLRQMHGCSVCGERDYRCLDFHHVDPSTKVYSIATMRGRGDREALKAELKKCVVICSNCHRKIQKRA